MFLWTTRRQGLFLTASGAAVVCSFWICEPGETANAACGVKSLIRLQTVGGELQYEAASRQEASVSSTTPTPPRPSALGVTHSIDNMNQLLDTLIYDEKIEKVPILPGQRPSASTSTSAACSLYRTTTTKMQTHPTAVRP
ncbi:unnamed protein product [Tilletia controversa]|nr:unnamed protein product [Tilletia controversa]CAD6945479.1 unnamed protein product [Tilletia controversa]